MAVLTLPSLLLSAMQSDHSDYPVRMEATLPGVPDTSPYEFYSGFLDAGVPPSGRGKMYFHYICAMAPNWKTMPLSIWYNGGPGAPSTFGLFQEFGPYLLTEESYGTEAYKESGVPTPIYNPWTWANLTSLCEIDSPAPMGVSFCTEGNGTAGSHGGPSGDPYSCGPWTDKTTAKANHRAHAAFFNHAFPEFEAGNNPVSLIGESYAGVYVPLFVNEWLDDPIRGPNGKLINFHGFAVGDGFPGCVPMPGKPIDWCVDLKHVSFFKYPNALPGPYWDVEFFHGHSQMSEALYHAILATCSMEELKGIVMPLSAPCKKLVVEQMADEVGAWYPYNLYEACPAPSIRRQLVEASDASTSLAAPSVAPIRRRMLAGGVNKPPRAGKHIYPAGAPGDGDTGLGAPCLGSAMDTYFGLNVTKVALGIPLDNNFIVLDNGIGFNYTTDASFVGSVYAKAIAKGKRVLVYEGDSDACGLQTAPIEDVWVPYFGNGTFLGNGSVDATQWTPAGPLKTAHSKPLGLSMTQSWRPFGVVPAGRKVQAGFVTEWSGGQVSFVSIRGAGHLLPLYRPAASYTMMLSFQTGKPLPPSFYPPARA